MSRAHTIACYYFPNYHFDRRNEAVHGPGWSEWELVKHAEPRFQGHYQPRVPLWGYEDEADPAMMARKIDAAADHGIDAFIFDWYWYDDGPFLERALDEGSIGAANNPRLKFALMWANHDWVDIHPAKLSDKGHARLLYAGAVTRKTFDLPYHPNVTVGWDPSPRTVQSDAYLNAGYPFTPTLAGNTPDRFREALRLTRERLDQSGQQAKILTLNAWTEWTEGNYLEPACRWGTAYLEAVRDVFGDRAEGRTEIGLG